MSGQVEVELPDRVNDHQMLTLRSSRRETLRPEESSGVLSASLRISPTGRDGESEASGTTVEVLICVFAPIFFLFQRSAKVALLLPEAAEFLFFLFLARAVGSRIFIASVPVRPSIPLRRRSPLSKGTRRLHETAEKFGRKPFRRDHRATPCTSGSITR